MRGTKEKGIVVTEKDQESVVSADSLSDSSNPSTSSDGKEKKSSSHRLKQVGVLIIAIIACAVLIGPSIAGYLNISVISTSGQFTSQECKVLLYEGDVVALLSDADASNDPKPIKENQIVVGQSTTFSGMNFGTYTMDVELLDEQANSQVTITPRTTTMWGIDNRQTYQIA